MSEKPKITFDPNLDKPDIVDVATDLHPLPPDTIARLANGTATMAEQAAQAIVDREEIERLGSPEPQIPTIDPVELSKIMSLFSDDTAEPDVLSFDKSASWKELQEIGAAVLGDVLYDASQVRKVIENNRRPTH